jgi:hypothetical protein
MCSCFNYTSTKPTTSFIFCSDHVVLFRPDGLEPETYFEGLFAGQSANASSPFSAMLQQDQPKGYPTHPDPRQD